MRGNTEMWAAGLVFLGALALPRAARADDSQVIDANHRSGETAQRFQVELRAGLYSPRVDSSPGLGGGHPYADAFGGNARVEVGAELDWQVLRIPLFGTLGPGIGVGYTSMSGGTTFTSGKYVGQTAGAQTSLDIYPLYAVAVLRLDTLDRNLRIPVVPYAKAGLGYALWVASGSSGTSIAPDGTAGRGHTVGTHFALGVDLDLNIFDPHAARELDNSTGINHTYLFAEYMFAELTGLGQTHAMYVGTRSPVFGLSFDF